MRIPAFLFVVATICVTACKPESAADAAPPSSTASRGEGLVFVPEGQPRPYFHDFGERLWGEQIEHVFSVENREGRTVVLQDLLPDCGCTRPRATAVLADGTRVDGALDTRGMNLEVPAGARLEVNISIDTTRVEKPNQHKLAQVRMRCDSDVTPYTTFELHVRVIRAFRAVPAEAVLKDVPQTAGKSVRLDITTENAGDGSRIREVEAIEGPFTADITETKVGEEPVWVLVVHADPGLPLGPHAGKVIFSTTRSDGSGVGQHFEVKVSAQIVTDCVVEPRVFTIPRDGDGTVTGTLRALIPGATTGVREVRVEGGGEAYLRADWKPADKGAQDEPAPTRAARWAITLRPIGELPRAAFSGKLVVVLDDEHAAPLEVSYVLAPR